MDRRNSLRGLVLGFWLGISLPLLAGCETLMHNLRNHDHDHDDGEEATEASRSDDSSNDAPDKQVSRGFFKSSRLSGAMSSEGREIERDLGIK